MPDRDRMSLYVRAEALYNMCQFEHALVAYTRGLKVAPDFTGFLQGMKKCRKTIHDCVGHTNLFSFPRNTSFFYSMQQEMEGNSLFLEQYLDSNTDVELVMVMSGEQVRKTGFTEALCTASTDKVSARCLTPFLVSDPERAPIVRKRKGHPKRKKNRMADDHSFLSFLAVELSEDIAAGAVGNRTSSIAEDTFRYFRSRDEFWNQIDN